ncbi:MAG: TM0996/MTH895 family glutaredoxin-like protein [Bacteroidales bacterium]|nr:TM0996/MTH895 family glutaredoxin-like protein [Bacteroidales bacterium]
MEIKILGSGCSRCRELEKRTREALEKAGFHASVTKVDQMQDIARYHVMATPALVVDEVVETKGRIPSVEEVIQILIRHFA